jgi:hypothetical protein
MMRGKMMRRVGSSECGIEWKGMGKLKEKSDG